MKTAGIIFLLLNPDIEISRSTISQLYNDLKEFPDIGIIGPRICYRNIRDRIFSDGGLLFPEEGFQGGHTHSEQDKNHVNAPHYNYNIKYVDGSALMFRKEILDDIGLMNTSFSCIMKSLNGVCGFLKHPMENCRQYTM